PKPRPGQSNKTSRLPNDAKIQNGRSFADVMKGSISNKNLNNGSVLQQRSEKDSSSTQRNFTSGNPSPSTHSTLQGQTPFEAAVLEHMNIVSEQMANFAEQFEKFNLRLD